MSDKLFINTKNAPPAERLFEGSQKLLQILTTDNHPTEEFAEFVTPLNNMVIGNDVRYAFKSHLLNPYDREHWWIPMDHCYARPWNWRPESTFLRPTKTLFVPKPLASKRKIKSLSSVPGQDCEDVIDVMVESDQPTPVYDKEKAKQLMRECERFAAVARLDEGDEDWEEKVPRVSWTPTQNRLFNGIVSIMNSDQLARLATTNTHNEPVARRVTVDKSVERVRRLMATVSWDPKYTQWLHQILIDNLSASYLAIYLDILQTLRSKLPAFVDKMMTGSNTSRLGFLGYENLFPLLKKPWDPVAQTLIQDKPKKLPGNPVIVVVPSTPISSKRMLKWINLLSNLATVVTIPSNYGGLGHKTAMTNCVDQMFVMSRNKIQDIRLDYPGRHIVLVGFGFGATLALQLAQVEQVLCVISIGFSLLTADGKRGQPDDNLLELQCPVLFVIGQCSSTSLQEDMEDLRERMRVETGLIIVGSADDNLRVSKKKKTSEGITQSVVDRCIADEIGEFISGLILSPYPPQIRQSPTNLTTDGLAAKKAKAERKRYNSNTSSVDSEPPSPTTRPSRPGQSSLFSFGRPIGSKTKSRLESKWAAQGIPSSPSNSPPHPSTHDTSSNDSNITLTNIDTSVKKIKTLKPTVLSTEKSVASSPQTVKALTLQGRNLAGLLQGEIPAAVQPTILKAGPSGIKVLENVKLTSGVHSRAFSSNGKIDLSKLTSNLKATDPNPLVLLPDGKIKTLTPNMKVPGSGKYITSKKQLLANRPRPVKKMSYMPQPCALQPPNLPPPTNLTTQDILDLPIIFADDNQIFENALPQPEVKPVPQLYTTAPVSKLMTNNANKFMVINKPQNFIIAPNSKTVQSSSPKPPPKYTKIILSSKKTPEHSAANIVKKLPPEICVKKMVTPPQSVADANFDLEDEIAASTLYKRKLDGAECLEIVTTIKPEEGDNVPVSAEDLSVHEAPKRSAEEAQLAIEDEVASKLIKLEAE